MGIFDVLGKTSGFDMIKSFMDPSAGYESAEDQIKKAWGQAQGYGQPYWQNGLDQNQRLTGAEDQLLDPSALLNKWIGGYNQSPYATQQIERSKNAGLDAASSMGLGGSSAALNNVQQSASDISNADRQTYLNDMMQKFLSGIGIGQNIYGTGAQMGSNLMQGAMNYGDNMGAAEYGRVSAPGDMFGKLLGMGANAATNYATGGMG